METKFKFYQEHGIEEYYLYNPKKNRLQGWLRRGKKLKEISQMEGWTSPLLGIRFTTLEKDLVLFRPDGERFVDYVGIVEQRDRAQLEKELEKQRAILAENERDRAQLEKELEKQRAIFAEITIEEERQKNQQLRDRLIQLGIDPETLS